MRVDPRSSANVSNVGKKLAELQQMQTSANKRLVSDLQREPPPSEPSAVVSLSAESVKLAERS